MHVFELAIHFSESIFRQCLSGEVPNLFLQTFNDLTGLDRAWWFCHHVNPLYIVHDEIRDNDNHKIKKTRLAQPRILEMSSCEEINFKLCTELKTILCT